MPTLNNAVEPLILKPIRIAYLWGHEDWCISAHRRADCQIVGGEFAGQKLSQLWQTHRALFGNYPGDVFPLLVKLIDTDQDVSIQVHPDDAYARVHENGALGKSECWYILNLRKGTDTAILGNHAKDHAQAEQMIRQKQWQNFLNETPIQPGSFLQIDPGTVHAVHGGTRFVEIQQNSDITYRLYDYDRLENGRPRQLHTEKAIACIKAPDLPDRLKPEVEVTEYGQHASLVHNTHYAVEQYKISGSMQADFSHAFEIICVIAGRGFIGSVPVQENTFLILPHGLGQHEWRGSFTAIAAWPTDLPAEKH